MDKPDSKLTARRLKIHLNRLSALQWGLVALMLSVFIYLYIRYPLYPLSVSLILLVIVAGSILVPLMHRHSYREMLEILKASEQESYHSSLLSMESLSQIVLRIYYTLEQATKNSVDQQLRGILLKAQPQVELLESTRLDWERLKKDLKSRNPEYSDPRKREQIQELNRSIIRAGVMVLEAVEQFAGNFRKNNEIMLKSQKNLSTLIYYLSNTIPMISDFSDSSNEFSRTIIKEVITLFEEIARFSMKISSDIQSKMQELMDESRKDSLVFIIQQTHTLVTDFEEFFRSLENLKNVSNHFVENSIEKLRNIAEFAVSIEDIAETIKVISLNVSIEAANTGSSARGFQVLARDLREFAQRTLRFAGDVKAKVQDTIDSTSELKGEYLDNMNIVYDFVREMKDSIENFKNIIEASFEKIQSIILILQEFAGRVDSGLKNIIGKLQYYDITSQEIEHLSEFIEEIFNTAQKGKEVIRLEELITSAERKEIQSRILENIERIITTKNERLILHKYREMYDLGTPESRSDAAAASANEEDSIILF